MIIIAVITGYMLGVAPVVVYFLWQNRKERKQETQKLITHDEFNEWMYGRQTEEENGKAQITQEDIFKEYTIGSKGGK